MTKKKQHILQSALKLFAQEGYQNTPTSKIAANAGVSEGLIFKHFKNKAGLLDAVIGLMEEDISNFLEKISELQEPKEIIRTAFEFPPLVSDNKDFWNLQFSLTYQCPGRKQRQKNDFLRSFKNMLHEAFIALNYNRPEMESVFLMNTLWELCREDCNNGWEDKHINFTRKEYINFIKQKYEL